MVIVLVALPASLQYMYCLTDATHYYCMHGLCFISTHMLGSLGMKRLDTVVSSLVLRRTKEDIDKTLNLTKRTVESHTITLHDEEKQVYTILFTEARKVMYRWLLEQGENVHMKDPQAGGAGNPAAVAGEPPANKAEDTDGATADEVTLPLEVQRLVNTIMRPYLIGNSKGRCVLGLLLR